MMNKASTTLRQHWPEYLMEAWGLGMFMICAGVVVTVLEYPGSPPMPINACCVPDKPD